MGIFKKGSHFFILPKAFLKKGIYGWMIFHFFEDEDKKRRCHRHLRFYVGLIGYKDSEKDDCL